MASIQKTSNGTYKVRWHAHGKHAAKTFTRRTDAQRWKRQLETQIDRGQYIDPADAKTRLDDWIDDWHTSRLNLRPSTKIGDHDYIRLYINPHLGRYELGHITPTRVRKWVATLNQTLAPATTRKAHSILSSALKAAVDDRMIATNPCQGTKLPQTHEPTHRYLTMPEVHEIANTIDPRYKAFVYTGALAGLRPGEIAALRLTNVDLRNQRLTVTHSAVELNGEISYGPPKTNAAKRTISIGQTLTGILTTHLDEYGPGSNVTSIDTSPTSLTSPLVFTSSEGGPLRLSNFRYRQWKRAVEASVGAPMRMHDLRHTHAGLAIAQGIHPKVLQVRMGHSSISVTMDIYGGLMHGFDEGVADALDDVFTASL